jgi:aryl-alcohol dehydrogenase-like predicted oxidoreductase
MQRREFGPLGPVSVLSLGGGGIGRVYGDVARGEAIATIRAAVDAGVTLLDLAPTYGRDEAAPEAELVVGAAFRDGWPAGLGATTKVEILDGEPDAMRRRMRESLHASIARLGVDRVALYVLHCDLRPDGQVGRWPALSLRAFREVVRPEFERLVADGLIGGWGLTAVGHPAAVFEAVDEQPRPAAVQCVVNAGDSVGNLWLWGDEAATANAEIRRAAARSGVGVMAIRAVAAGALTASLDREAGGDDPAGREFAMAAGFRSLARDLGMPPAVLAYRYALSVDGVSTVVLGVKNRGELAEALEAERAGALPEPVLVQVQSCFGPADDLSREPGAV